MTARSDRGDVALFSPMRWPSRRLDSYLDTAGAARLDEIRQLARPLQGARVLHLSFSPYGTALSELVGGLVPLLRDVGLEAEWQVVSCPEPFQQAAHELYRGLSGRRVRWGQSMRDAWRRYGETLAESFPGGFDAVVVHEPQPLSLAARQREGGTNGGTNGGTRWFWHTQLDLRHAQPEVWEDVWPDLKEYTRILLSTRAFAAPELTADRVFELPPALDPLLNRNVPLSRMEVQETLARYGIDPHRPLAVQVGPLDNAHDPLGTLRAFREAKLLRSDAQLLLLEPLGSAGGDAWARFEQMLRKVAGEEDVHVLAGVAEAGHLTVNAVQRAARVVLQRAVPAGHPLTVLEAQWKGRPVIVGRGNMRDLILPGESGVVAEDNTAFAAAMIGLLGDEALADRMGALGHDLVKERFLITRALRDELRLLGGG
jgi:trehalose synthase